MLRTVLVTPTSAESETLLREAAHALQRRVHIVRASSAREFDAAFASFVQEHSGAVFISSDPLFTSQRAQLVALAAKYKIPASYAFRDFVEVGGLMSYGVNLADIHRQAGAYAGRILRGAKPPELPVLQPTKFDLVINSTTARALSIAIPPTLLVIAEMIE